MPTRRRFAELWLAGRMTLWIAALPLLKRLLPLPKLVAFVHASPRAVREHAIDERRVCGIAAALARRFLPGTRGVCLERSLVTYRFLGARGFSPDLVIGMGRDRGSVVAHAWVEIGGRPISESSGDVAGFVPVVAFGRNGEVIFGAQNQAMPVQLT